MAGLAITITMYSSFMNKNTTSVVKSYSSYYTRLKARGANAGVMQIAMKRFADSNSWRSGYSNLALGGSNVKLTLKDTTYNGQAAVKLVAKTAYYPDSLINSSDTLTSSAVVSFGIRVPFVGGAWTAQGILDNTISQMLIDGRDHDTVVLSNGPPKVYQVVGTNGVAGVATAASSFTNSQGALIGGTDQTTSPWTDHAPANPQSPTIVQLNAFPGGFPTTPDAFLTWPEGTLKSIAQSGTNGSRFITRQTQLDSLITAKKPLTGVTYVEVAHVSGNDTTWSNLNLYSGSGGIFIVHCPTLRTAPSTYYNAFVNNGARVARVRA